MTELPPADPAPQDADELARLELARRLGPGSEEPVLLSSDISATLRRWDPATPASYWAVLDGEQVALLQGLQAAAGAEVMVSCLRDPLSELEGQAAPIDLGQLVERSARIARGAGAPWTMAAVPARSATIDEVLSLAWESLATGVVHGVLVEGADVDQALAVSRKLAGEGAVVACTFAGSWPTEAALVELASVGCVAVGAPDAGEPWAHLVHGAGLGLIGCAGPDHDPAAARELLDRLEAQALMAPADLSFQQMAELAALMA